MKNQHQQTTLENHPEFKETAQVDNLFRLINYNSKQAYDGYYIFEATVFNNQASIRITWIDTTKSTSLNNGAVVRVMWLTRSFFINGTNIVCGLERVKQLTSQENLFATIPDNWIANKKQFNYLISILIKMDSHLVRLITHMLIDEHSLYNFLNLPFPYLKSMNMKGGNCEATALNLDLAANGLYYQRFKTSKEVLKAVMIIIGITRHQMWVYDDQNKRFFIPAENKKMQLNILAIRLINDTNKKYKLNLNAEYAHELDKVLKNKSQQKRLVSYLWLAD